MEGFFTYTMLSRIQFAFTAMFHIIWPVVTIGLSLFMVYLEVMWLRTKNVVYYHHLRFWMRIFVLNVAVGVVTGIPLEFQFGTNWKPFAVAGGDFFGHMMGFEASMAFMLEATFIGIMVFGWKKVSPRMHLFATCMVALGASLSAFWIMVTNSWMHTPAGGYFENGRFVLTSHWESIFNPDMPWGVSHMYMASLEISVFVVGGISAWYIYRKVHVEFFLKSFKMAFAAALLIAPMQILLGHGSGIAVFEHQPAKLAAIEAHWDTNPPGEGAPWNILAWPDPENQRNKWALEVPYALSLITTNSLTGEVKGLKEFPVEDQAPVFITFYSLRIMILCGVVLLGIVLWTLVAWRRGELQLERISENRRLLMAWMIGVPLSYLAMQTGWITREVGRQPWIIYGMMRTDEAATVLPQWTVWSSLLTFAFLYPLVFALFLVFARRILNRGPDFSAP